MIDICKFGTYYEPASNHYGCQTNVICDRRHKDNLTVCFGWNTHDLCLQCKAEINAIDNIPKPHKPNTKTYVTKMIQNQFWK